MPPHVSTRAMRSWFATLPLVVSLVAGCIVEEPTPPDERMCLEELPHLETFPVTTNDLVTHPGQDYDILYRMPNQSVPIEYSANRSDGGDVEVTTWGENASAPVLIRSRTAIDASTRDLEVTLHGKVTLDLPSRCVTQLSGQLHGLANPMPGAVAEPGKGVHVYTAGFWENGTIFYTNIAQLDRMQDWPRAGWYSFESGDALPVYVYDESSDEQPPYWDPFADTDLASQAPYQYFPTIPGFNNALNGLSENTIRVTWMPPEQAYTREGNEDHPLYGDAILFWINIQRVVDYPCPNPIDALGCQTPGP